MATPTTLTEMCQPGSAIGLIVNVVSILSVLASMTGTYSSGMGTTGKIKAMVVLAICMFGSIGAAVISATSDCPDEKTE